MERIVGLFFASAFASIPIWWLCYALADLFRTNGVGVIFLLAVVLGIPLLISYFSKEGPDTALILKEEGQKAAVVTLCLWFVIAFVLYVLNHADMTFQSRNFGPLTKLLICHFFAVPLLLVAEWVLVQMGFEKRWADKIRESKAEKLALGCD